MKSDSVELDPNPPCGKCPHYCGNHANYLGWLRLCTQTGCECPGYEEKVISGNETAEVEVYPCP